MNELRTALRTIREDYLSFAKKTLRILYGMAFGLLLAGGLSVYLLTQNAQRVHDIQQSRRDNTVEACLAQNDRHDNTIAALDAELAELSKSLKPAEAAQLKQSRDFTVLLINALAPYTEDCDAKARRQVQ